MQTLTHIFAPIAAFFHGAYLFAIHLAGTFYVLPVLTFFCFVDGFLPLFPSETLMIGLGSLWASDRAIHIVFVAIAGAIGAFLGDVTAFYLGRKIPLRKMPGFRGEKGRKKILWTKSELAKRGTVFILAARFIPLGRIAVNMTAGAVHYPRRKFIPTAAVAGIVWSIYSVSLGAAAGTLVHDSPLIAVALGVLGGIILGKVMDKVMGHFAKWWYGDKYEAAINAFKFEVDIEDEGEAPADGADDDPAEDGENEGEASADGADDAPAADDEDEGEASADDSDVAPAAASQVPLDMDTTPRPNN